jgi:hypothetical protein
MAVITFIIAPVDRTQIDALALAGVQHPLAPEVMDAVRQRGQAPVALWLLINSLANARQPDYRDRRRCWRLRYLRALGELLKVGLLYRRGPLIAAARFAILAKPKTRDRTTSRRLPGDLHLSRSVVESTSKNGGSKPFGQQPQTAAKDQQTVELEPESKTLGTPTSTVESQTAPPTELVSIAARQLARLPRRGARRWSGWLSEDVRSFRNMRVQLPGGDQVFVFGVLHGRLVYTHELDGGVGGIGGVGTSWGVIPAKNVEVVRNPHAVLLGRGKLAVRERKSSLKQASARRNGAQPCRPGKKRGRPPKPSFTDTDLLAG